MKKDNFSDHPRTWDRPVLRPLFICAALAAAALLGIMIFRKHADNVNRASSLRDSAAREREAAQSEEERLDSLFEQYQEAVRSAVPGIICWGDGLTAGIGGNGTTYPLVLQQQIRKNLTGAFSIEEAAGFEFEAGSWMKTYRLSAPEVLNMGAEGESTDTILGRSGAVPFVTAKELDIPAGTDAVPIELVSSNGNAVAPLLQSTAGMADVTIAGIKGIITIEKESGAGNMYGYRFTRSQAGKPAKAAAGTEIITEGSRMGLDYFPVIFIGLDEGYKDPSDLIRQQRALIERQEKNGNRFIVIGLHTGAAKERAALEEAMEAEYGDKYINLREYMCGQGMEDLDRLTRGKVTPSAKDEEMLSAGMTPSCVLDGDGIHFNRYGYELLGRLVYDRMDALGYFRELKDALK